MHPNVKATAFEVVDNRFLDSNAAGATAKVMEEPEVDTTYSQAYSSARKTMQ